VNGESEGTYEGRGGEGCLDFFVNGSIHVSIFLLAKLI
jgi:hypothetical protein